MFYNRILLVTDNLVLFSRFRKVISGSEYEGVQMDYCHSPNNDLFKDEPGILPLVIKDSVSELISKYDLIISLHCKQLFPVELVERVKCINIHPGYNPVNRGFYPQIFSIINKSVMGATIHEIDALIDHGNIICRTIVETHSWDTSLTVYNRILDAEIKLIEEHLFSILNNTYTTIVPENKGNLYLHKDFTALCKLDLAEENTLEYFINKLRALTHGEHKNAYFIDPVEGKKVYVRLSLEPVDM